MCKLDVLFKPIVTNTFISIGGESGQPLLPEFPKWGWLVGDNLGRLAKNCMKSTKSVFLDQNSGGGTWGDRQIFQVVGSPSSPPLEETLVVRCPFWTCQMLFLNIFSLFLQALFANLVYFYFIFPILNCFHLQINTSLLNLYPGT